MIVFEVPSQSLLVGWIERVAFFLYFVVALGTIDTKYSGDKMVCARYGRVAILLHFYWKYCFRRQQWCYYYFLSAAGSGDTKGGDVGGGLIRPKIINNLIEEGLGSSV